MDFRYRSISEAMDMVRKLILDKLAEKNLDMKAVSLMLPRAHSFLYQFLKKGTPRELHERDRMRLAEILGVPPDDLRGPSTLLPKRSYERKAVTSRESFIDQDDNLPHGQHGNAIKTVPNADLYGASDLPVYGTTLGKDGTFVVSDVAVDWVTRPAMLLRVSEGYGLIVSDDLMAPEHKAGSIALVNPHLPGRIGHSCVFRNRSGGGTKLAIVREFRGQTETHWKVHQHNPPKDVQLKKADWDICHRTVGNYFP